MDKNPPQQTYFSGVLSGETERFLRGQVTDGRTHFGGGKP